MSQVFVRPATYDEDVLRPLIFAMMDGMGGAQLDRSCRVLIKPNLLSAARPGHAVLTHPAVVRCVVEYCLDKGVRPIVADSPAIGSFETILRMSGIGEALAGTGVECRPFRDSVKVDVGEPFGEIDIAEEAVRSDVIINLPKFKTHAQMLLTLSVKNLFGCIVGFRKPEWHLRAGADRQAFARLLVRIGRTLRPAFNILDGILAMEGQGPGRSGVPRELGILMAGKDPFAVDSVACRVIGLDPEDLPLLKAAASGRSPARARDRRRAAGCTRFSPPPPDAARLRAAVPPRVRAAAPPPATGLRCESLPDVRRMRPDLSRPGHHAGRRDAPLRLRPVYSLLLLHRGLPGRCPAGRRDVARQAIPQDDLSRPMNREIQDFLSALT